MVVYSCFQGEGVVEVLVAGVSVFSSQFRIWEAALRTTFECDLPLGPVYVHVMF